MIEISFFNYISPIIGGTFFMFATGFIPEHIRQRFHATVVTVAAGTYLGFSYGKLEILFTVAMALAGFMGHKNWKFVALAWFLHGAVDWLHHNVNDPVLKWYEPSSFECIIVDWYLAIWFFIGAPNWT